MDVQHYISSGILESYVFGMLPEEEQIEVEIAALQYPDIRAAVRALQQDKERFVQMYAITPPAAIKDKILAMIHEEETADGNKLLPNELQAKTSLSDPTNQQAVRPPANNHHTIKPKPVIAPKARTNASLKWKYATAVVVTILIGSVLLNFFFFSTSSTYEGKYNELITTKVIMDTEKEQQNTPPLSDSNISWTHLEGTGELEPGSIDIGWNKRTKEVMLLAQLMPSAPKGTQFHLWAVEEQTYKHLGIFATGTNGIQIWQQMKQTGSVDEFVISLQAVGEKEPPTSDEILMRATLKK